MGGGGGDAFSMALCLAYTALALHSPVGRSSVISAVPPRPQDGTVLVIVLFTIVFGCVQGRLRHINDGANAP